MVVETKTYEAEPCQNLRLGNGQDLWGGYRLGGALLPHGGGDGRPRTLVVKTLQLGNGQDPIGRDQDRRHGPCGALLPHGGGEQQDL